VASWDPIPFPIAAGPAPIRRVSLLVPGVVAATGHYRHGILLTPMTAQKTARYVRTGTLSDWIEPFQPARFDTVSSDFEQV